MTSNTTTFRKVSVPLALLASLMPLAPWLVVDGVGFSATALYETLNFAVKALNYLPESLPWMFSEPPPEDDMRQLVGAKRAAFSAYLVMMAFGWGAWYIHYARANPERSAQRQEAYDNGSHASVALGVLGLIFCAVWRFTVYGSLQEEIGQELAYYLDEGDLFGLGYGFWVMLLCSVGLIAAPLLLPDENSGPILTPERQRALREQAQAGAQVAQRLAAETAQGVQAGAQKAQATAQASLQELRASQAVGQRTTRAILGLDDSVVVADGTVVTREHVEAARAAGVLEMLLGSTEPVPHAAAQAEAGAAPTLAPELEQLLGRTTGRAVLDAEDNVILPLGGMVTRAAIARAEAAGVLEMLKRSVEEDGV